MFGGSVHNQLESDLEITFVVGPPRSGTTLLAGLLCTANTYPLLPECSFLTNAIRQHTNIRLFSDQARREAYFRNEAALDALFGAFIRGLVSNAIEPFPRRRHLVLKDPELTAFAQELPRFFTNPIRTICIVRDPRDVVTSLRRVAQQQSPNPTPEETVNAAFDYYFKVHQLAQSPDPRNRIMIVRYEDIATGHTETFAELDKFVGYSVSRTGFGEVAYEFDRTDPTFSPLYGGVTRSDRIGIFRELSADVISNIQVVFSGVMAAYKYEDVAASYGGRWWHKLRPNGFRRSRMN